MRIEEELGSKAIYAGEKFRNPQKRTVKVVMVRHGESTWNALNLFTGWQDVELSETGKKEAAAAGETLKEGKWRFDSVHTSELQRAQNTLGAIKDALGGKGGGGFRRIQKTWRLNERHYGNLTGMDKAETAAKFGDDQVKIWRRSFDVPPPAIEESNKYFDVIQKDKKYEKVSKEDLPVGESLELTIKRTMPYWEDKIVPQIKKGRTVLIVAHGNSLRGIVKSLDKMSNDAIMELNLPTGIPFVYEIDCDTLAVESSMQFLGDEETVKKAMAAVAAQGTAKK
jgi:2,3-bisphosphoglycerate-dependent phosphoglycerate mutase